MSKLELWQLGNTRLKLSYVGFGASPLGNVFGIVSEEEANASVREAFCLGINFFDTSPLRSTRSCTRATPVGSLTYSTTWTRWRCTTARTGGCCLTRAWGKWRGHTALESGARRSGKTATPSLLPPALRLLFFLVFFSGNKRSDVQRSGATIA